MKKLKKFFTVLLTLSMLISLVTMTVSANTPAAPKNIYYVGALNMLSRSVVDGADVNNGGSIDSLDYASLQKILLGASAS